MNDESSLLELIGPTSSERFWRSGHFVYESGLHGDLWLALRHLFADPRRLKRCTDQLARKIAAFSPDLICGPLVGGALVGQFVALSLDLPFAYAESEATTAEGPLRFSLPPELRDVVRDRRVVVVDDAINAGAATLACARAIEALGGKVVAAAALLVRAPGAAELLAERSIALESLVGVAWHVWPATTCPLCRAGAPFGAT